MAIEAYGRNFAFIAAQVADTRPGCVRICLLRDAACNLEQICESRNGRHLYAGIKQDSNPRFLHLSLSSFLPMVVTIPRKDTGRKKHFTSSHAEQKRNTHHDQPQRSFRAVWRSNRICRSGSRAGSCRSACWQGENHPDPPQRHPAHDLWRRAFLSERQSWPGFEGTVNNEERNRLSICRCPSKKFSMWIG